MRLARVFAVLTALVCTGCASSLRPITNPSPEATPVASASAQIDPTPTLSKLAASPSPTDDLPAPDSDLTKPGQAMSLIKAIMRRRSDDAVVKVDIKADELTLHFRTASRTIVSYHWERGELRTVDSDVADVEQATFDPRLFNLDDIGSLFREARRLGLSEASAQLQIVDYDGGNVLMTVTTSPESATVFFRRNGTPITHIDYERADGIRQGLADVTDGHATVLEIGIKAPVGMWADLPRSATMPPTRKIRPAKHPPYALKQAGQASWEPFSPSLVDARTITKTLALLRTTHKIALSEPVEIVIDNRYGRSAPTMTFKLGPKVVVTDLSGVDLTEWIRR